MQNQSLIGSIDSIDAVITNTEVSFGFLDRIKVLFGWNVSLRVVTPTNNIISVAGPSSTIVTLYRKGGSTIMIGSPK